MFTPRKILVIKFRAMGDTILMTAPLSELRKAYPDAEIHVVVTASWAPLLEHHPAVNRLFTYERHKEATARAKAIARLALTLRKERYDCVINFHASGSSSALAYAIGAKTRSIHFHGHNDKNLYSTVEIPGKGTLKPIIERDMDAVRALGVSIPEGAMPSVFLSQGEIDKAKFRLDLMGLQGPLLCLGIGASRPTKTWPLERFASIAIRWVDQYKGSVVVLNSRDEEPLARKFYEAIDEKIVSWYSDQNTRRNVRSKIINEMQVPLRQLASILSCADLYLGNDSGPKHLAVAVGTPTITIFGPEDPFEWHPYPKGKHPLHFIEGLKCRKDHLPGFRPWCGLNECVAEEHRCMKMIAEDDVFRTIERVFDGPKAI